MARTPGRELALSPAQVGELFTPARLEIYESLQLAGPASVAELAQRLGRAADSLYYHLRKLLEIGVVRQLGDGPADVRQPRKGRAGAIYGIVAQTVTMRLETGSKASRTAWSKGATAVLRLAERNVKAALESRDVRTEGPERGLLVKRSKLRLTRKQLREVNAHIEQLQAVLQGHADNDRGRRYALNLVMTPLETTEQEGRS